MESYNLPETAAAGYFSTSPDSNPSEIDALLSAVGYQVRSSDLRQVAHNLENAMVNTPVDFSDDDIVHYNPSDLSSWLNSLSPATAYSDPYSSVNYGYATWPDQIGPSSAQPLTVVSDVEEKSGIRLVHMLLTCAESLQRGDISFSAALIDDMRQLLKHVTSTRGIGKVAGYFIDALFCRIYRTPPTESAEFEREILYHHYYEACPYLKFAHFTANQAILEAFNGHDRVHVIDFSLRVFSMGLQWPPLIQALALRPGGPPSLTLTGIGPHDNLREVGLKLGQLARSVNVRFTFNAVVEPHMAHVDSDEVVAVNSVMELHRLIGPRTGQCMARPSPIDSVLGWVKGLNPKIFTVVEQEADHNGPGFLNRFNEALHYYSTLFDSLEACRAGPEKALAEVYIQREICNVVSCEGLARIERHEPLASWRARMGRAGFRPLHLGSKAFKQASVLLTLFSAEGFCVEENDGCLTLGWHSRPLLAASAWRVGSINGLSSPKLS